MRCEAYKLASLTLHICGVLLRVVVLAGGKGSRAKPFSELSPKVMIPVNGRPVIDYVVRHIASFPIIDEILIVCSQDECLSGQVKSYFEGKENLFNNKISFIDETVGGTGGAVLSARPRLEDQDEFLVWFGDNLVPLDITSLHRFSRAKRGIGCVVVSTSRRTETGFVEVASDCQIIRFKEKPTITLSEPECLGIYLFNKEILKRIDKATRHEGNINLSFDVLENLTRNDRLYCYDIAPLDWIDAESPAKLERNKDRAKAIIDEMRHR